MRLEPDEEFVVAEVADQGAGGGSGPAQGGVIGPRASRAQD